MGMENRMDANLEDYVLEPERSIRFLSAKDYKVGDTLRVTFEKMISINKFGRPVLLVKVNEKEYYMSLNKTNQHILARKYRTIKDLLLHDVTFQVIETKMGKSFQAII